VDDYILTPIVPCSKCGVRYAADLTRDGMGRRLPEKELQEMDLPSPLCDSCRRQKFGEALEADILYVIEHGLGLTAENKETLKALVTIVDNQDKALMVAHAANRVDALERKLEDRTAALEDKLEDKLDSMESRVWISSWVTNFLFFLCGALIGVVATMVFGG
jgi:hypothetical protein